MNSRKNDKPIGWLPSVGIPTLGGAGIGAMTKGHRLKGGAIGAGIGALFGLGVRKADESVINNANKIMKLPKKERLGLLKAMTKNN